jgi:preprotein translocase subunit SecD
MKAPFALVTACLLTAASFAAESTSLFQIRLVSETPTSTSEPMVQESKVGDQTARETMNVEKAVLIDETGLDSAWMTKDNLGHIAIDLKFNGKGTEQLATVTQQNLGKRVAIVIDGHLYQAPFIRAPLTTGSAQISGNFSKEEASDLVKKINASAKKK